MSQTVRKVPDPDAPAARIRQFFAEEYPEPLLVGPCPRDGAPMEIDKEWLADDKPHVRVACTDDDCGFDDLESDARWNEFARAKLADAHVEHELAAARRGERA